MTTTSGGRAAAWSIAQVARMSAVTSRTLRHYDDVGLVTPAFTGANGYRYYEQNQLLRLQQVLLLRELGLGLAAIAKVLTGERDQVAALEGHRRLLHRERSRLDLLTATLSRTIQQLREGTTVTAQEMFDGFDYVHGYRPQENDRLRNQADTLLEIVHGGTCYPAGSLVLEAGCGVGAQTLTLAARSPEATFTSVDLSRASVAEAQARVHQARLPNVTVRQGDLFDLPFPPACFDHVFVCFVLEHLDRPVEALQALRRLVRPAGTVTVVEGDHGLTSFHPDDPDARAAIDCQVQLQTRAGGNALIGRQLHPLMVAAGLRAVTVAPRVVYVDATRPDLADAFTRKTFTAMVAGVRDDAVAAGLTTAETFDAGLRALERTTEADGVFTYTFFKGAGTVP